MKPTHLNNVYTEQLAGKAWETHIVSRGNLKTGLIAKPTPQRGFYQGWKSWVLGWDDRTVEGSCRTFFGRNAKRDAIHHATGGKQ